jgi:hypothetical protein
MGVSGMTEESKRQDKEAQESGEKSRWDKIRRFFLDNPTLAFTLLYIYAAAIGMLYSAVLYRRFGIVSLALPDQTLPLGTSSTDLLEVGEDSAPLSGSVVHQAPLGCLPELIWHLVPELCYPLRKTFQLRSLSWISVVDSLTSSAARSMSSEAEYR